MAKTNAQQVSMAETRRRTTEGNNEQRQYQNKSGNIVQSLNWRKYRRSHPLLPALNNMPKDTNEKENALMKQITKSIFWTDSAENRADNRKGIKTAFSKPTIDTGENVTLRINETVSMPENMKKISPKNNPSNQQLARRNGMTLQAVGRTERR